MSLNAATIEVLLGKGLSGDDLLDVARAMEANTPRSSAAARQARYRERKLESVTNDVTSDVTQPPKENKSNPPSVSDETGGEPPDPVKELFDVGVSVLKASGQSEKQARSLIGGWRKSHGDGEVMAALVDCRVRAITNPIEWMPKRLAGTRRGGDPPSFLDHMIEQGRRQEAAGAT